MKKVTFLLGKEFGYSTSSVSVELLASQNGVCIIKLPVGFDAAFKPSNQIADCLYDVSTDFIAEFL
jgi:hypothetical protein